MFVVKFLMPSERWLDIGFLVEASVSEMVTA